MNASNSPPAPRRLNWVDLPPEERFALLRRTESDLSEYLAKAEQIIQAVREEGDSALVRFAQELDKADSFTRDSIRVSDEQITAAPDKLDEEVREAIAFASESIRRFHKDQLPESFWLHEIRQGAFAGERTSPLEQVACYVPRGKGAFPSVFLMTVVPALVAGVKRIVVLTPPGADGTCDTATLAAANAIAAFGTGAIEIYLVGGAQAVAAVAHGTETVPKCPRILGPGSPWVAAARRLLADKIDPGVPAGPSEAIIFADGSVGGELAAMDLLVEAEHGADSSAYLVTTDTAVANAAANALPKLWAEMDANRVAFSSAVLSGKQGGILLVPDAETAYQFINDYAPEHLEILSTDPFKHLDFIRNAGEILLGAHTPVPLGNFVLGANAILPTGAKAQYASPLSVFDYMKRTSVGFVTKQGYPALAKHAERLARYEGFSAHARAVSDARLPLLEGLDGVETPPPSRNEP